MQKRTDDEVEAFFGFNLAEEEFWQELKNIVACSFPDLCNLFPGGTLPFIQGAPDYGFNVLKNN